MKKDSSWKIIGPGGAGSHYIPTISPHDPNIAVTCSDMTGAYITYDGGASWRQFNLRIRVDSFAFDPVKPGVIYAGSTGLFRSEDNGESWELILPRPETVIEEVMVGDEADNRYITKDGWPGGKVQAIFVDPEKNSNIYAGVNSQATLIDARSTTESSTLDLFCSSDFGSTWSQLGGAQGSRIFGFYVDGATPQNNRTVYVLTDKGLFAGNTCDGKLKALGLPEGIEKAAYAAWGMRKDTGRPVFYLTSPSKNNGDSLLPGVWKSADMGATWERVTSGIEPVIEREGLKGRFSAGLIGTCAADASKVYITARYHAQGGETALFGIYKSEDEGESWTLVHGANKFKDSPNHKLGWVEREFTSEYSGVGPKGNGFIGIGVCPSNPDICYVTDMGAIHRTIDGGSSWEQVYSNDYPDGSFSNRGGMEVTTCYGLHFDPFDSSHMVISYTDMGMAHSLNGGETWHHAIKGVPPKWSNTCYWMVFDPEVRDRGWGAWAFAHDLPRSKMFDNMESLRSRPGGICRTENGARSWEVSNKGMPDGPATHVIIDPSSPAGKRTLYTAVFGQGVYKSTDDGYSWVQKNNGLGEYPNAYRFTLLPDGTLYLIAARARKNGAEEDGALFRSLDGGDNWEKLSLPSGVNAPNDLVFDPANTKRMYLACWPRTINSREYYGGVYSTDDGGETWNCIFDQSCHAYGVTVDANDHRVVYLVTFDSSAFRSEDMGRTWQRLGGYNFKWGHRVVNDPVNKEMIYITTYGSSVWHGPAKGEGDPLEELG